MIIDHTIAPSVNLASGEILLHEETANPPIDSHLWALRQHSLLIVQTRDAAIRDALIKLGWTPPQVATEDQVATSRDSGTRAGRACQAKAERVANFDSKAAGEFMLRHLGRRGDTSSEILVEVCKIAGYKPHDDRAFGPVIAGLARRKLIRQVGSCSRKRGNGTAGGRVWALSHAPAQTNRLENNEPTV